MLYEQILHGKCFRADFTREVLYEQVLHGKCSIGRSYRGGKCSTGRSYTGSALWAVLMSVLCFYCAKYDELNSNRYTLHTISLVELKHPVSPLLLPSSYSE